MKPLHVSRKMIGAQTLYRKRKRKQDNDRVLAANWKNCWAKPTIWNVCGRLTAHFCLHVFLKNFSEWPILVCLF